MPTHWRAAGEENGRATQKPSLKLRKVSLSRDDEGHEESVGHINFTNSEVGPAPYPYN